jgi:hypothetical protein
MKALVIAMICAAAVPARAWDGPGMWYRAADDANPGGGGILGTGGSHDHGIKCSDCHVDRVAEAGLAFGLTFSPALVNGGYVANQRYTITAKLSGALLGVGCNAQDSTMHNTDNFAAAFEADDGSAAGMLAADDGQAGPSCALPSPAPAGTTALDGDCHVVFAQGKFDTDTWTFTWTAPAAGSVHVSWGAVDGNCDMMSMNDAVVTGTQTLGLAPSSAPAAWWRWPTVAVEAVIATVIAI